MRRILTAATSATMVVLLGLPGVSAAAADLRVDVRPPGRLLDNGSAVLLRVAASCREGLEVLEAFVYVTQDGEQSQFAGIPVSCNGRSQRFVVRVATFEDARLEPGEAQASAYLLVQDPDSSTTHQVQDVQLVRLR